MTQFYPREHVYRLDEQNKSPRVCEVHGRLPIVVDEEFPGKVPLDDVGRACYTLDDDINPVMLWQCPGCLRWVCDGFGGGDAFASGCDDCWSVAVMEKPYILYVKRGRLRLEWYEAVVQRDPGVVHSRQSRRDVWQYFIRKEALCPIPSPLSWPPAQ